jgi:hypothetical protein
MSDELWIPNAKHKLISVRTNSRELAWVDPERRWHFSDPERMTPEDWAQFFEALNNSHWDGGWP